MPRAGASDASAAFTQIAFERVCYDYGRRRVLSRVSFACEAGTMTGLLGPNGAGKSTLMGVAALRAHPSAGVVRYGDRPASALDARRLRGQIGWLGHDPGFYPEMTARENLRFYARLHDVPDAAARVTMALARAGLSERAEDAVGGFSRGMRQRLGLERVLLHAPRLVLLDEPFTGLDDASAHALRERLVDLKTAGAIVLLTTHDLAFVSGLLDRAVVLRNGRVADAFDLPAGGENEGGAIDLVERYRQAAAPGSDATPAPGASGVPGEPVWRDVANGSSASTAASDSSTSSDSSRSSVSTARTASSETGESRASVVASASRASAARSDEEDSLGTAVGRFISAAAQIARKDLIVEYRSRELFLTTLFFAISCVLVFAFAFVRDGRPLTDAAAGILWIAVAFAGTLALGRTFEREQSAHTLQALLQAPIDRAAVYVGKLLGLLALLALVQIVVVPLVSLFFQTPLGGAAWMLALMMVAGTIGFLAVGTLFSAMLVRTRSRDVLLPVLLYPMTVPVMLAGVRGSSAVLQATPDLVTARMWLSMLVLFDVLFVTLALWTFDVVTSE